MSSVLKLMGLMAAMVVGLGPVNAETVVEDNQYIIFYHNDALGSPSVVTDHNGNTLWHEHSDPYGRTRDRVMPTGKEFLSDRAGSRKGYTGHLKDSGSDLVYMKARYYDPVIGRFYSNDPVGFTTDNPMMFNRYAYGNNSPYNYIDPDGMAIESWADLGVALYEGGQAIAAAAAAVVGSVTGDDALRDVGIDALKSEALEFGVAMMGLATPGAPSGALVAIVKAKVKAKVPKKVNGPDFVVTKDGTAVPVSQSQMRKGFDDADFPSSTSKITDETAITHTVPTSKGPIDVRTMEGGANHPRRTVFSTPGQPRSPRTPDGGTPRGTKQQQRAASHLEQSP